MNLQLQNKIAVITGGDSGIGMHTAAMLANEGVTIVLSDLDQQKLNAAAEEIRKSMIGIKIKIHTISCNIDDNANVLQLAKQVEKDFGGADIVIHCAGTRGAAGDFLSLKDEDWMKTINTDLMGAVRICRAFIPQIQKKGWGRVVLISSENAYQPYVDESPYNACKAGIINLSKCLSRAYSKDGILFNCVSPAYIETPMTDGMMNQLAKDKGISKEDAIQWFLKNERPHIAMGRRGKPEEVAAVITFLVSEQASYVNGSNYRVDGGSIESAF